MKTPYRFFAVGVLYGFGLGIILDTTNHVDATSISLLLAGLLIVPALGWLETYSHERRIADWQRIRAKGKSVFIVSRYVLLRGGIFSIVLMLALRGEQSSWPVHEIVIPLVFFCLAYVGYQEWRNCEIEYGVLTRRDSADWTNAASE